MWGGQEATASLRRARQPGWFGQGPRLREPPWASAIWRPSVRPIPDPRGLVVENKGQEPLVSLRYFGPDTWEQVPNVGDYRQA